MDALRLYLAQSVIGKRQRQIVLPAVPVRSGGSSGSPDARALSCAISCPCDRGMPLGGRTHRPHPLTMLLVCTTAGCRAHWHSGRCANVTSKNANITITNKAMSRPNSHRLANEPWSVRLLVPESHVRREPLEPYKSPSEL